MDTTTVLLIAIPVLVVLAGVLLFATARRRDTGEAIGALGRETRKRDRGAVAVLEARRGRSGHRAARSSAPPPSSGARPRKALATVGATAPVAVGAARPRGARRHPPPVLQPRHRHVLRARPGRLRRVACSPSSGRSSAAGFGSDDQHRQHRRRRHQDRRGRRASPTTPRAACGSPTTRPPRSAPPASVYSPPELIEHGGGLHGALPEVRAPRLPRAGVQDVAVVRVPVPRLAVQPQRREEGRPGAARPRPLPAPVVESGNVSVDTAPSIIPARRSAPTPPARRPKARTASAAGSTESLAPSVASLRLRKCLRRPAKPVAPAAHRRCLMPPLPCWRPAR